MRRTITEAIFEAHQNKLEYDCDWYVLNDPYKSVVKLSYFYNDIGTKKEKPFKSIYNTSNKKYRNSLVELLGNTVVYVNPDKCLIEEEHIDKFEIFNDSIKFLANKFFKELHEAKYSYIDTYQKHFIITFKLSDFDNYIYEFLQNNEFFKHIKTIKNLPINGESTFFIDNDDNKIYVFTFCIEIDKLNMTRAEMLYMLKSFNALEKFNL